MGTHQGRSVGKEFQVETSWVPITPVKPHQPQPRPSPIYDDGCGGLLAQAWKGQEEYLSGYTQQQSHSHTKTLLPLPSYSISSAQNNSNPTTSNHIWDVGQGNYSSGRIQQQRQNDDVQRRGLEDYIPHWTSQGRRSPVTYGSNNFGSNSYTHNNSWDSIHPWTNNVLRDIGGDSGHNFSDALGGLDPNNMTFGALLGMNGSSVLQNNGGGAAGNDIFYPNWVSQSQPESSRLHSTTISNQEYLHRLNQQSIDAREQGMQNGAVPHQQWRIIDSNVPQSTHLANGNSVFAPATPDSRSRIASDATSDSTVPVTNQLSNEHKSMQEDVAATVDLQERHKEQIPGSITETSPGNISVAEEDQNPDKGNYQGIDLNKTPQKKARRRRYQPKVIRETKPKQTPNPKTPKTTDSKETQAKRRYVRKKKTDTPVVMPGDEAAQASESKPTEQSAKSCKRSLNFDLNGQVTEQDLAKDGPNAEPQANERQKTGNSVQLSKGAELFRTSRLATAYDLNRTVNQELRDYISLPTEATPASSSLSKINAGMSGKDSQAARSSNSSPCASSNEGEQTRGPKRRLSYRTDPIYADADIAAATHSASWQPSHIYPGSTHTTALPQSFIPEICKRKRTEKVQRSHIANHSSSATASEEINQKAKPQSHPQVELTTSKYYYCDHGPSGVSVMTDHQAKVFVGRSETAEQFHKSWPDLLRLNKKKRSKGATRVRDLTPLTGIASAAKSRCKKTAIISEPNSDTATLVGLQSRTEELPTETNVKPRAKRRSTKQDSVNKNQDIVVYGSNRSRKRATGSVPALPWRKASSIEEITQIMEQLNINRENRKVRRREQKSIVPYHVEKQEQTALVPYAQDNSIVPFEGPFDPIRKRRQRAKVELDDETSRVWRLLLENIDSEGINGTDEDKAKWWESERTVFQGRVDSFIARMRLVQGDRRFTPWKGSVLDSVIGVFLTQNVSDHLSSSAFMSMAARFPLKPESSGSTQSEEATSVLVEEPDICVLEPEESITWNAKTVHQPTFDRNSRVILDSDHSEEKEVVNSKEKLGKSGPVSPTEYSSGTCQLAPNYSRIDNANNQTAETEVAYILGDDKARDDATSSQQSVLSSQNSINSPNLQSVGLMNTFSESRSSTQAVATGSQYNYSGYQTSFLGLLSMVGPPIPQESYNQTYLQKPIEDMKHATEYFPEAGVSSSVYQLNLDEGFYLQETKGIEMLEVESRSSDMSRKDENSPATEQSNVTSELTDQEKNSDSNLRAIPNMCSFYVLEGENMIIQSQRQTVNEPLDTVASSAGADTSPSCKDIPQSSQDMAYVRESTSAMKRTERDHQKVEQMPKHNYTSGIISETTNTDPSKTGRARAGKGKKNEFDWDSLRREAEINVPKRERPANHRDSLDWEAVRHANVSEIAETIKERGMNNMLAERIKDLLDRLVRDHGSTDMEWLRDIPPDKAKEFLLSFRGLGLKSVECVRLLTLHHLAFPVDTNVGRIAVRLGWVPLQPLPESLQLHLLELYPVLESIQKYLWPRLCKLDQKTLYELHYHLITFGKVFCTKRQPNCNACPLRGECRHFASAFASARFALPGPEERSIIPSVGSTAPYRHSHTSINLLPSTTSCSDHHPHTNCQQNDATTIQVSSFPFSMPLPQTVHLERKSINSICEPIVEVPASPEPEPPQEQELRDMEDFFEDSDEIPTISLNMKQFTQTLQNFMHGHGDLQEAEVSNALVALTAEAASLPTPKLKNISRLRTEHHVYELPDTHPLLHGMNRREPDDPGSYLLAIWTPGETATSIDPPARKCNFNDPSMLCNEETCSYCSSQRESNSQTVRGTLLIPCRTAMRGSFPLNGTYFQVNEVFADHDSSLNPIAVPREWLWNLPRRTVYFGTSIPTLFRGMSTEDIQHCFWRGYVCVRGFDQKSRAPRPLMARLHFPASRLNRGTRGKVYDE